MNNACVGERASGQWGKGGGKGKTKKAITCGNELNPWSAGSGF